MERFTIEMQDKEKDIYILRNELLLKEEALTKYRNKENTLKACEHIYGE